MNDESGLGKRVQTAAFVGAIDMSDSNNVIIICADSTHEQHWRYTLSTFAPNVNTKLIDVSSLSSDETIKVESPFGCVYIISINNWTFDIDKFKNLKFDLLVLDEGSQYCTTTQLNDIDQLKVDKKIILCSENIMVNYYINITNLLFNGFFLFGILD